VHLCISSAMMSMTYLVPLPTSAVGTLAASDANADNAGEDATSEPAPPLTVRYS